MTNTLQWETMETKTLPVTQYYYGNDEYNL